MTPTLLIHGGAGTIARHQFTPERLALYIKALQDIAKAGQAKLLAGESAVDVVAYTVSLLEDNPLFNAGTGSVLTANATIEMDACIMNGQDRSAGAVASISNIKNPIYLAKAVMKYSPHVCLAGTGAEVFAQSQGMDLIDPALLVVPERLAQLNKLRETNSIALDHNVSVDIDVDDIGIGVGVGTKVKGDKSLQNPIDESNKFGTVGAVALDMAGNLASATSTGGMTNKMVGRVGDTPIIGAGCYANDLVAISTTGTGEAFMRGVVAHDISARMRYAKEDLATACDNGIHQTLAELDGEGGLIAIDKHGNIALPMNTDGMYRAVAIGNRGVRASIFQD